MQAPKLQQLSSKQLVILWMQKFHPGSAEVWVLWAWEQLPGAAIIGGTGGHVPPTFWLGGRKGKCPPTDCQFSKIVFLVSRHFSGSLQNAYLGEELKGFCIIKIQFLSASAGLCPSDPLTRGSAPGPRWGSAPRPPTIQKKSPPLAATHLTLS